MEQMEEQSVLRDSYKRVLALHAEGYTSKQAARKLSLSSRTIDEYLKAMKKILNAKNSANLIFIACKAGVI